jgi:hypothetical protein
MLLMLQPLVENGIISKFVFVTAGHFNPSLIFFCNAGANLSGASERKGFYPEMPMLD